VRPAGRNDGGDITFRGFKDGIGLSQHEGLLRAAARHRPRRCSTGIQNLLQAFRARRGRSPADVTRGGPEALYAAMRDGHGTQKAWMRIPIPIAASSLMLILAIDTRLMPAPRVSTPTAMIAQESQA
jgi:hypothetical protein